MTTIDSGRHRLDPPTTASGSSQRRDRRSSHPRLRHNGPGSITRTGHEVDVGSWLDAYRRAWEDADAEAAAALFDDRATYRSNIFQEPYEGPAGVRRYWQEVTSSQSQVSVRMGRPFVDGNRVAAEFWTTMLVDGAETTLPGCLLLEFGDDGRCRSLREYWHFEGGLLEPPPEWGT